MNGDLNEWRDLPTTTRQPHESSLQSLEGESMNEKSVAHPPQVLRTVHRDTCTNGQVLYLIHG
jgi:hypothetical protein